MIILVRRTVLVSLALAVGGCFTLHPTYGVVPAVGERVAFDLNDAGRAALGGTMGPEIAQIQGQLLEQRDQELRVAVSGIRLLRGGDQVWRGEAVTVRQEYIGTTYLKKLSPGRSIALGVITLGGFTAFMLSTNLFGLGLDEAAPPDTGIVDTRLGRP